MKSIFNKFDDMHDKKRKFHTLTKDKNLPIWTIHTKQMTMVTLIVQILWHELQYLFKLSR
jgi:hypothetical protein